MKEKIIIAYAICFMFFFFFAKAVDGTRGFWGYELPIKQEELKTNVDVRKTESSFQYYRNSGVIDLLAGNRDSVEVKVYEVKYDNNKRTLSPTINWVIIKDKAVGRLQNLNSSTSSFNPGIYTISFRRHTWCLTKASHSGGWYLDESILRREESI